VLPSFYQTRPACGSCGAFHFTVQRPFETLPAIRPPVHAGGFFISAREAQGFGAKTQIIGSQ
jgi:hypothetical protein